MTSTITAQDVASTSTPGQDGQSIITGTPTAGSTLALPVTGSGALAFELLGTWTGSVTAEGSVDGVEWVPSDFWTVGLDLRHLTVTANGQYKVNVAGFKQIRLRSTATMTGTISINYLGTVTSDLMHVVSQGNISIDGSVVTLAAAVAATYNSADLLNHTGKGVQVIVDLTVMTAATVTTTVYGKDPVSGKYYALLASTGATATGTTVLTVYPGVTVAANAAASIPVPKIFRVGVVVANNSGTAAVTGTVGVNTLI